MNGGGENTDAFQNASSHLDMRKCPSVEWMADPSDFAMLDAGCALCA